MKVRRTFMIGLMLAGAAFCLFLTFLAARTSHDSIHGYRPIMLVPAFLFGAVVFWIRRGAEG